MRRLTILLTLVLVGCSGSVFSPVGKTTFQPIDTHVPSLPATTEPALTLTLADTMTASGGAHPTTSPTLQPVPGLEVRFHPDGALYSGDLVSIEVIVPDEMLSEGEGLRLQLASGTVTEASFAPYGIGKRQQATLLWVWDTAGLEPGNYKLQFSLSPGGLQWTDAITLLPEEQLSPLERTARWVHTETDCCLVYYLNNTAAARDIKALLNTIDQQMTSVEQRMGTQVEDMVTITILPRVLGHGGFAGQEIAVSYLDRDYAANDLSPILHHEMVHILDAQLGGELRPTLFVEGLAVYLTGGHYKEEPLMSRAAALLPPTPDCISIEQLPSLDDLNGQVKVCSLNWYLPLVPLMDDFYFSQHEISYLEAGALIEFMVRNWGWEAYSDFYRDIHPWTEDTPERPDMRGSQANAVNAALVEHFGVTIEQLETLFLKALAREQLSPAWVQDVAFTVDYYDTMRRYQQLLDPSAYFLTAWLPDTQEVRTKGIVADFYRHPESLENLTLETMLIAASDAQHEGNLSSAQELIETVNDVLDEYPTRRIAAILESRLAKVYWELVHQILELGYQPQRVRVKKDTALAWVTPEAGLELVELCFDYSSTGWMLRDRQTPTTP